MILMKRNAARSRSSSALRLRFFGAAGFGPRIINAFCTVAKSCLIAPAFGRGWFSVPPSGASPAAGLVRDAASLVA
jgi:hypothetical protein